MTSWHGFALQSAWPWKVLLALTFPFWAPRAKAIWPLAGGWQQSYGRRHALGIKPPRLLQSADSRIGDKIFLRDADVHDRVRSVACHELTHAFTADLRLPAWFKEGVAMVAVDRFFDRPTVKRETLETLGRTTDQLARGATGSCASVIPTYFVPLCARLLAGPLLRRNAAGFRGGTAVAPVHAKPSGGAYRRILRQVSRGILGRHQSGVDRLFPGKSRSCFRGNVDCGHSAISRELLDRAWLLAGKGAASLVR